MGKVMALAAVAESLNGCSLVVGAYQPSNTHFLFPSFPGTSEFSGSEAIKPLQQKSSNIAESNNC